MTSIAKEKTGKFLTFLGVVFLYAIILILLGHFVIFREQEPEGANFQMVRITQPTPPVPLPRPPVPMPPLTLQAGGGSETPLSPAVIMMPTRVTFNLPKTPSTDEILGKLPKPNFGDGGGTGMGSGLGSGTGGGEGTVFGGANGTGLKGYFCDLKQTTDRQSTGMSEPKWFAILRDYVSKGWDDSLLDKYYQSKSPLFTNSFAIPTRPSEDAPAAFHLEKECQGGCWCIHYHGKVVAPEGDYRFEGEADCIILIKIDGVTIFDGGWWPFTDDPGLHKVASTTPWSKNPVYISAAEALLKYGKTFHMDAAAPVDMDVLIGDNGGLCSFYLLIEKTDSSYETLPDGSKKLPFFLLNSNNPPSFASGDDVPPHSDTPEPWQTVETGN